MEGKREEVTKDGANASHHHFTLIRTTAGEDALTMTVSQAGKLQRASVTSDAPKDIELVQLASNGGRSLRRQHVVLSTVSLCHCVTAIMEISGFVDMLSGAQRGLVYSEVAVVGVV